MLVLTRKSQETVVVGGADGFETILKVTVLSIKGGKVRPGLRGRCRCSRPSFGGVGANPRRVRERQADVSLPRSLLREGRLRFRQHPEMAITGPAGTSPTEPNLLEGEPDHVTLGNRVSRHRSDRRLPRLRGSGESLLGGGEDPLLRLHRSRGAVFPGTWVQKGVVLGMMGRRGARPGLGPLKQR